MFMAKKRRGLFGSGPDIYGTPPFNPEPSQQPFGTMAPVLGDMNNSTMPMDHGMMAPPQQKVGLGTRLLGKGWEDKAFALGGILQGDTRPAMMMRQQQQQLQAAQMQRAMELADEQRKRAMGREDKMWEWQNKPAAPAAPYRWESNDGSLMEIGPDGAPRVVYQDPTPKINWVEVTNRDGTKTLTPMPIGGMPQGPLPTFTEDDWNSAGGPAGNGGGSF